MKIFKIIIFLLLVVFSAKGQTPWNVFGKIISISDSVPVAGAIVKTNFDSTTSYLTNERGIFAFKSDRKNFTFVISHLGYVTKEVKVNSLKNEPFLIILEPKSNLLQEIQVSTGFQNISKERSTGSFSKIDNSLFNREVSTDVISRLDGIASAVQFDRRDITSKPKVIIRGLSTIFSNASPLVILNNFPYEGDISNINPNDVENITILKDAAAASIWGVRAGNGVIVINTKKGSLNQPLKTNFTSNLTVGVKPDMRKLPLMNASDFIDVEKMLFEKGFYDAKESDGISPLSPVVETLFKVKRGEINQPEANRLINGYRIYDLRNDLNNLLYQTGYNQQYALNFSGGSNIGTYYVSTGLDDNLSNLDARYRRFSLRSDNTLNITKNLSLGIAVGFNQINDKAGKPSFTNFNTLYPYARFIDENGSALAINRYYSSSFIQNAEKNGLLDWTYRPFNELALINERSKLQEVLVNADLNYNVSSDLKVGIKYQFNTSTSKAENLQSIQSYEVRSLVNNFTQLSGGDIIKPIPSGDILDLNHTNFSNQSIRGQIDYRKSWGKNEINALGGTELRQTRTQGDVSRLYGYNSDIITSKSVDYETSFDQYNSELGTSRIPYLNTISDFNNRFVSFFLNSAYTYDTRYTISGSVRKDGSNLFGVKSNQRIVPLWSVGGSWGISNEPFYKSELIPFLKLRATFGYSGNLNQNVSAYPIMFTNNGNLNNSSYGVIRNPPNDRLIWEKAAMYNLGLDFRAKGNIISGSIEYYKKKNNDLIGYMPVDQTTGAIAPATLTFSYLGNSASMQGQGIDIDLHSLNLNGQLKWNTDFLFSYATTKVTSYLSQSNDLSNYITGGQTISPIIGKPVYSIFAYKSAGLDPQTGDPLGYLHGLVSKDYALITSETTPDELIYKGSALPTKFGALRNTFSWKAFSLSANISYRLGYFFRRNSVSYQAIFNGMGSNSDFNLRWQKPGDEAHTDVPSLIYPSDLNRDSKFYPRTETLISKGDNIRLQDVNLSYKINKFNSRIPFKSLSLNFYATNLGILWKADNHDIDPDYGIVSVPKTYSIGLKAEF